MMHMSGTEHTGHCLCGAVRYRATAAPRWSSYCHCADCRRATGAPVVAYAGFARDSFHFEGTPPARFRSSPGVVRCFCPICGTPLTYEGARWPDEIHLLVGSADRPEALAPQVHVYTRDGIPWLAIADDLPRHPDTFGEKIVI